MNNVSIKSFKEIELMRTAGQMAADTLLAVSPLIRAGVTTDEINTFVHEDTVKKGGWPAPLKYQGFPKSVCTSINEVVCPASRAGRPQGRRHRALDITTIY